MIDSYLKNKIIEAFIKLYTDVERIHISKNDVRIISEKEVHSPFDNSKGSILQVEVKDVDVDEDEDYQTLGLGIYNIMDRDTAKITAYSYYNNIYDIYENNLQDFIDFDTIGGIENFITSKGFQDIRNILINRYEADTNEMLENKEIYKDELQEISKKYNLDIDDSDFGFDYAEKYIKSLSNRDIISEMIEMEGDFKSFLKFLTKESYIDMKKLFDSIIDFDGYGPILAQYDGEELEFPGTINGKTYYAFRIA